MISIVDDGYDVALKSTYSSAYEYVFDDECFLDKDLRVPLTFKNFRYRLYVDGECRIYNPLSCEDGWFFKVVNHRKAR